MWICGLGGMGKISLVFEVCRRLFGEKWRIFNVELRYFYYVYLFGWWRENEGNDLYYVFFLYFIKYNK